MRKGQISEQWKKIEGVPPHYEVSSWGNIRVLPRLDATGRPLPGKMKKYIDAEVILWIDKKQKGFPVAALVLRAFVGPPPDNEHGLARHLDDNRNHNHVSNLAWGSYSDNMRDAIRNGRSMLGRKWTPEQRAKKSLLHLGRRHSEETKRKMADAHRGRPGPTLGRNHSPEHRARISAGLLAWNRNK